MSGVRLRLLIAGRVQGVGFRAFVAREARALGLGGYVRNLGDGRVEAEFAGQPAAVEALRRACGRWPVGGRVERVGTRATAAGRASRRLRGPARRVSRLRLFDQRLRKFGFRRSREREMPTTFLWFLFDWRGRLDRGGYRLAILVIALMAMALEIVPFRNPDFLLGLASIQLFVQAALDSKRLHDIGRSAAWIFGTSAIGVAAVARLVLPSPNCWRIWPITWPTASVHQHIRRS